ncbi:MAG: DUF1289 domain-containing protein [Paracoccus sp. (in: a-proteobacteria)]|uniref:DUF1289 domain-containing protein n=1 Tax=Paracoccus sp. TaxID=267 RepID=UPI00391A2595
MTSAPPSPCIRLCAIDPGTRLCSGCLRSLDEIARWSGLTPAQQRAIIADLPHRRATTRP